MLDRQTTKGVELLALIELHLGRHGAAAVLRAESCPSVRTAIIRTRIAAPILLLRALPS